MSAADGPIVTADWLEQRLGEPGLSIVDAAWYLPQQNRDPRAEYDAGHIPGAVFFDQDLIVDPDVDLPHAIAPAGEFARHAGTMGITANDTIVVYDGPGFFSAPRVWWLFTAMGAAKVFVLEGGLDGWRAEGRPLTAEPTKIACCYFDARLERSKLVAFDEMARIVQGAKAQIVDARPAGRFTGRDPEPRPGMRSGHMPGAFNIPAVDLSEGGRLLGPAALREKFEAAGVDLEKPIVTSCGSGVTAAVLVLALTILGHENARLYDGSWSEWGGRPDTPVETDA